jgi:hypothetical protein
MLFEPLPDFPLLRYASTAFNEKYLHWHTRRHFCIVSEKFNRLFSYKCKKSEKKKYFVTVNCSQYQKKRVPMRHSLTDNSGVYNCTAMKILDKVVYLASGFDLC